MEKPARGERQQATRDYDTGGFHDNVLHSRISPNKICSYCSKSVKLRVTAEYYICPECGHKKARLTRKRQPPTKTITLSERDVARVLMAVSKLEEWKEFATHPSIQNQPPKKDFLSFWIRTPEGWPVPSRKLMEEIEKLLS